jgi:hypothetical protein
VPLNALLNLNSPSKCIRSCEIPSFMHISVAKEPHLTLTKDYKSL